MRKHLSMVQSIALAIIAATIICNSTSIVAKAASQMETFVSIGFDSERDHVNEIIGEYLNEQLANEDINRLLKSLDVGISWRYDRSLRLVEYNVGTEFLSKMDSLNRIFLNIGVPEYPTVYIPIFGELSGSERIIGHIKLYYTYAFERSEMRYSQQTVIHNITGSDFESGRFVSFFESISNLAENTSWDHAFLLRFPSAFNDSSEKILLIYDGEEIKVYDLYNSAGVPATPDDQWQFNKMYSYDEYVLLRREREKTIYSTVSDIRDVQYGGNLSESKGETKTTNLTVVTALSAVVIASAVAFVIVRGVGKKKTGSDS